MADLCTPKSRAMPAPVDSPELTRRMTSAACAGVSFGRRPPTFPCSRACAKPILARSRTINLSNSANEPSICIILRPAGVLVSMASVKEQNLAPTACKEDLKTVPLRSLGKCVLRRHRRTECRAVSPLTGSGANFLKCMFLAGEGLWRF